MFKSLDEVKAVAEKFEAGKIIPARVLKGMDKKSRNKAHKVKFFMNVYRLQGIDGNVFVCDWKEGKPKFFIDASPERFLFGDFCFKENPYGKGGNHFIGNLGINDDEFLANINRNVFGKTAMEA